MHFHKAFSLFAASAICFLGAPCASEAQVKKLICVQKSGLTVIRERKCRKGETILSKKKAQQVLTPPVRAGRKGSSGSKGSSGQKGGSGPKSNTPGFKGSKGPAGNAGPAGPKGTGMGHSYYEKPQSGSGAFGAIGGDYDSKNPFGVSNIKHSFNFPMPVLADKDVIIKLNNEIVAACAARNLRGDFGSSCCVAGPSHCYTDDEASSASQARCGGTADAPAPSPGTLCIYPTHIVNAAVISASGGDGFFTIQWFFDSVDGDTAVEGVWAYKAPL